MAFSTADFSDDRLYRYSLTRWWGEGEVDYSKCVFFIGLNPSTADETVNDPTITREMNFAKQWGLPGLVKGNLFAYRATDPKEMKNAPDPIGTFRNDDVLVDFHNRTSITIAAWGTHGVFMDRGSQILGFLWNDIYCLGICKNGQPRHPLYLPGNTELKLLRRGMGVK